jgi:hypothetical protein
MATAAVKREALSRERWLARCVELAEQRHMTGTAYYLGTRPSGSPLWRVPSGAYGAHVVTAWTDGQYTCSCRSAIYQQPCSHIGAAVYAEKARKAAERDTSPSQEYRYWKNTTA